MFRFSSPVTLRLERGDTLAFRRGLRARITVRAGVVHLTRQGDAQDHFLQPGQAMDLRGSVWIVVEAAQPALLSFEAPARWPLGAALARWLRQPPAARGGAATVAG